MHSKLSGSKVINCPPKDAKSANLIVYYLVKCDPPHPSDFIPWSKRNKNFRMKCKDTSMLCEGYGLSVYTDMNDARIAEREFNSLKGRKLAKGILTLECGSIKQTPRDDRPSHHTWWFPCEMNISDLFEVIPEEEL